MGVGRFPWVWPTLHGVVQGGWASGGEESAFCHGGKFGPGDVGVDSAKARKRAEPAVRTGHDAVAAKDLREAFQALGHEAGVFDEVRRRVLKIRHTLPASSTWPAIT